MSDYTTTDDVRHEYVMSFRVEYQQEARKGFDAWLAEHDAKVRAETLREAAEDLNNEFQDIPAWLEAHREGVRTNEWMVGGVRMVLSAVEVLRDRADRIEKESGL